MLNHKKIQIKICLGTTCHVLGGAELQNLEADLPENITHLVEVRRSNCLGLCKNHKNMKAPYVLVDEQPVSEASVVKVLDLLTEKLLSQLGDKDDSK